MDELNSKISATRDESLYWAQAVGLYGYNVNDKTMYRIHSSEINDHSLSVAVTHSVLPDGAATEAKQNDQIDNQKIMINFLNDQNDSQHIMINFLNDQNDSQHIMINNQGTMINFLNDQNDSQHIMINFLNDQNDSQHTMINNQGTMINFLNDQNDSQHTMINNQGTMINFLNDQNDSEHTMINNQGTMINFLNDINDSTNLLANCVQGSELQVDIVTGGSVQYNDGDALGATPTGTVMLGNDINGKASVLNINNLGELKVKDPTLTSIDDKITQGSDKTLTSVQQNGMYAWHSATSMWERLSFDTAGFHYGLSVRNLKRNPDVYSESVDGPSAGTAESSTIDLLGYSRCTIFGTTTNTNDAIQLRISSNNSVYITDPVAIISPDPSTGEYVYSTDSNLAVRYLRIRQTDDSGSGDFTLNINTSRR